MPSWTVQAGLLSGAGGVHGYSLHGRPAVSVTKILRALGLGKEIDVPPERMQQIFANGHQFHDYIEGHVLRAAETAAPAPAHSAAHILRVSAWLERFATVEVEVTEFPMAAATSSGYVIGGRVDAVLVLDGVRTIVDWKRAPIAASDLLQMAGYRWLAQATGNDVDDGIVISAAGPGEAVAMRPSAAAALTWQTIMRLYGAADRDSLAWGIVVE